MSVEIRQEKVAIRWWQGKHINAEVAIKWWQEKNINERLKGVEKATGTKNYEVENIKTKRRK